MESLIFFSRKTFLATCALCVVSFNAQAGEKLTRAAIEDFYTQSAEVHRLNSRVTLEFLERHVHDDAKATITTVTALPGLPVQKEKKVFNKTQLLAQTKQGQELSNVDSLESDVLSVRIAKDGRSAAVRERSVSSFSIDIPAGGQTLQMKSEQTTLCDTNVVLNQKSVIQVKETVCNVEAQVVPNM